MMSPRVAAVLILIGLFAAAPSSAQEQPTYKAISKVDGTPFDLAITETGRFPTKSYLEMPGFHQRTSQGARWMMCAFRALAVERGFSHWLAVYPPQSSTRIVVGFASSSNAKPEDVLGSDYVRERLLVEDQQPANANEDRATAIRRADAKFLGSVAGPDMPWSAERMASFCGPTASLAVQNCETLKGEPAIVACGEAIRRHPQHAPSYYRRGLEYRNKGDHDRAIEDFSKVIGFTPKYPKVYVDRGTLHYDKGDLDQALADFSTALQLEPKNAATYYSRGNIHSDKGDIDRALADYTQSIAIAPRDPTAYNARCWLRATANRDLPLALADCNAALRLAPVESQIFDSRGFLHLRLGRLNEAIADYDAALKLEPKLAGSLYGRGLAKLRKGDKAGGEADVSAAKAVNAEIAEQYAKHGVK